MNKLTKSIIILTICLLTLSYKKTYAQDNNTNLDLLIDNKKNQEILKEKITYLENSINQYIVSNESNKSTQDEIVSVSFVPNNEYTDKNEDEEVKSLQASKMKLEDELENLLIESVKIEKIIEEETKKYLNSNNLEYIKGIWPLESYKEISSNFGERVHPITKELSFHRGIDIPAPESTDILAADDGIVVFSGTQNGYGNVVKIKHFDGKKTVYAHNSYNIAKEGDIVQKGRVIAKVGSTGNSTGNHVHFEVIVGGENINPKDFVNK